MTLNVFNACTAKKLAINLQYDLLTLYIILGYPFLVPYLEKAPKYPFQRLRYTNYFLIIITTINFIHGVKTYEL